MNDARFFSDYTFEEFKGTQPWMSRSLMPLGGPPAALYGYHKKASDDSAPMFDGPFTVDEDGPRWYSAMPFWPFGAGVPPKE